MHRPRREEFSRRRRHTSFVQVIDHCRFAVLAGFTGGSKIGSQSLYRVVEVLSSAATLSFRFCADFHFHSSFICKWLHAIFIFPYADDCAPLSPPSACNHQTWCQRLGDFIGIGKFRGGIGVVV
jgi:hypothetical protein